MSPVRVLLATRNAQKLVELRRILASSDISGVQVLGLDDVLLFPEIPETAATFEGNALAKARDAAAATGLATVADDSGLAVDAGCCRPDGPAAMAMTPQTCNWCSISWRTCQEIVVVQRSSAPRRWSYRPGPIGQGTRL